jgi:DNA polymerase III alpha subunit (gram-positive type)
MAQSKPLYVYSDIETESFRANKILQIAAITANNEKFSIYINPEGPLPEKSIDVTGLYFHNNQLYRKGRALPSVSIKKALNTFAKWLLSLDAPVHLVFHNAFAFDILVLMRHFQKQNIPFPSCVLNVHDSLPAFRKFIKVSEISGFKLGALAEHFKVTLADAHNAIDDAGCLRDICEAFVKNKGMSIDDFLNSYIKPVSYFHAKLKPKK